MTLRRPSFASLCIILAVAAIVVAGVVPWRVESHPLRWLAAHQLSRLQQSSLQGSRIRLSVLPVPRFDIDNATYTNADGQVLMVAERATIELPLVALLSNGSPPYEITLFAPRIMLPLPHDAHDLWRQARSQFIQPALFAAVGPADSVLTRLTVNNGSVLNSEGNRTVLRKLDAAVSLAVDNEPLLLAGTALWRGEKISFKADKLQPEKIAQGQASPFALRFSSRPVTFTFNGTLEGADTPALKGGITFRTESLDRALSWLDLPLVFSKEAGKLALTGIMDFSAKGMDIPDARINFGGGEMEGSLAARFSEHRRLMLSATLAADKLDLSRFAMRLTSTTDDAVWRRDRLISGDTPPPNDLDIRFSANTARFGSIELQNMAAGLILKDRNLEVSIGQADAYGGSIKGRLVLGIEGRDVTAHLNGAFDNIEVGKAIESLYGVRLIAGTGKGHVTLQGRGETITDLARSLDGLIRLQIDNGNIVGTDLHDVIQRVRARPLATALDWRGGRTPFNTLNAALRVAEGIGTLEDASIAIDGLRCNLSGRILIGDRNLAIRGQVISSGDSTREAVSFPIEVSGNWNRPLVTPDIRALIKRSGAIVNPVSPNSPSDKERTILAP